MLALVAALVDDAEHRGWTPASAKNAAKAALDEIAALGGVATAETAARAVLVHESLTATDESYSKEQIAERERIERMLIGEDAVTEAQHQAHVAEALDALARLF